MIGCREREFHDCCLKSYGVFDFGNMWLDLIPNGVEREHCNVDAAPGG